jgi:GT2 family glycosyltransferase
MSRLADGSADMRRAIWCVIVNWNACSDTLGRLETLTGADALAGVVVVDNGSADASVEKTRAAYPNVTVIEAGTNLGFAAGNNLGIRHALESGADYIWLLNNDANPFPDALEQMLIVAESDPGIGAVGSVLWNADQLNVVQSWGGGRVNLLIGYNSVARNPQADEWFDYMCAASLLVRRKAFIDVGLLDEGYFLYWEDVDFGLRLRRAGWKLGVAPKAIVPHRGNASTADSPHIRDRYFTASGLRFLDQWSPYSPLAKVLFLSSRVMNRLIRGDMKGLAGVLNGAKDHRAGRSLNDRFTEEDKIEQPART